MKKIFLIVSALAGLFLAASCQQENLEPVAGGTTVTYTVEAPGALQTKAIADGTNVDELIYEVWYGDQKLYQNSTTMAVDPADGRNKAKVTLDLVNDQTYTILFWAQVAEADAYVTDELTLLHMQRVQMSILLTTSLLQHSMQLIQLLMVLLLIQQFSLSVLSRRLTFARLTARLLLRLQVTTTLPW